MARGIGFGQYLDTESPIHDLDARTKVVGALATMISLFCIHTPAQLILGLAFIIAVTLIARIGIKRALEATSYVLVMILILAVINLFLTTSGTPLVELGFIRITDDGVMAGSYYEYSVQAVGLRCDEQVMQKTDQKTAPGFSSARGIISGHIAYGSGTDRDRKSVV